MSSTNLPASLRPASHPAAQRSSLLGPSKTPEQRVAEYLRQIDVLHTKVEELGGRPELFQHLSEKLEEMRLEGEALKKGAGMASAFDHLPIVRETDAMLAHDLLRDLPAFA